jgi:pimeloyl-ACP methyl ester carboxylesterase
MLTSMASDLTPVYADGPWTHRDVSANGARFHVAELGDGPLALFLHGFPQFWWTWREQLTAFADAGYRAVAMDLRGIGGSDKPPRGYDPLTATMDVTGVIRALGESNAVLVGHGLGAGLAWTAATMRPKAVRRLVVTGAAHPRQFRTALLTSPSQIAASKHIFAAQRPIQAEHGLTKDDGAAAARLLESWSGPGWPETDVARRYRDAIQIPGVAHSSMEYFRWQIRSLMRPDGLRYHQRMRTLTEVPTLHLHGALDTAVLDSTARGSGGYVNAPYRWRLLEGLGHFPHEEAPKLFTNEVLGWLQDEEPDR